MGIKQEELIKYLEERGYTFGEETIVQDLGYDHSLYRYGKKVGDNNLRFEWYWDEGPGEPYWYATLTTFQPTCPNYKWHQPVGKFQMVGITARFLCNLEQYEQDLINAKKQITQYPNYENSN